MEKNKKKHSRNNDKQAQEREQNKKQKLNNKAGKKSQQQQKKKTYKKIKIDEEIYYLGNTVLVQVEKNENTNIEFSIAKIDQIWTVDGDLENPMLKVQWYMHPSEIGVKKDFFGQDEVFESDVFEEIEAQSLDGHCKVLSLEDYEAQKSASEENKAEEEEQQIFYTRAKYLVKEKQFDPPIQEWKAVCSCKKPANPDKEYIGCDVCDQWFHIECVNISEKEVKSIETWSCKKCSKKNSKAE